MLSRVPHMDHDSLLVKSLACCTAKVVPCFQ